MVFPMSLKLNNHQWTVACGRTEGHRDSRPGASTWHLSRIWASNKMWALTDNYVGIQISALTSSIASNEGVNPAHPQISARHCSLTMTGQPVNYEHKTVAITIQDWWFKIIFLLSCQGFFLYHLSAVLSDYLVTSFCCPVRLCNIISLLSCKVI